MNNPLYQINTEIPTLVNRWGEDGVYVDLSKFLHNPISGAVYNKNMYSNSGSLEMAYVGDTIVDPLTGTVYLKTNIANDKDNSSNAECNKPTEKASEVSQFEEKALLAEEIEKLAKQKNSSIKETGELLSPYDCMQKLINVACIKVVDNAVYFYNKIVYEMLSNEKISRLIVEKLRYDVAKSGHSHFVTDIRKWLLMEPKLTFHPPKYDDLVAFKNGIFDLKNENFFKSNPEYFLTSYIDVNYDKYADEYTPFFDSFLAKTFAGKLSLIDRVWEMLGYILTSDMNAKVFFLLQGVGNSGKSVLGRFIASFFNNDATSSVDIFSLGERFSLYNLVGKRINASLDLPSGKLNAQAVSIIKQLTGGDPLTAEAKYENAFKFQNTCKLVFATNHTIRLIEADEAFESRCVIIPFNRSVPKCEQDFHLQEKFEAEKAGIVKKALKAYCRLKANQYQFSGEEYICTDAPGCISEEQIVASFVASKCEFTDKSDGTFTFLLHDAFIDFCNQNNFPTVQSMTRFSQLLKLVCGDKIKSQKWRNMEIKEGPQNGYKGIIFKK